jgi:hypothetical protein
MRTALRLVALGVLLVGITFWFFGGPNLGWTRTSVPVHKVDPVTGIEYVEWPRRFVPGVDFLGACAAVAAVVFATSWLAKARSEPQPERNA